MKNLFNKDYFENGVSTGLSLYTNYRWIPELTIPMAFRIIEEMDLKPRDAVLDYGCSKGYLVHALRLLYRNAYGVDVSDYAISEADAKVKDYLQVIEKPVDLNYLKFIEKHFKCVIAKDVFEHIPKEDLRDTLTNLRGITEKMFVVVPLGNGAKYNEAAYENDVTHIIREDIHWWGNLFEWAGFHVTSCGFKMQGIKANWKCENGNGIFKLE
jgi:cyclopropane fatty-acyl-phospholipid synthase-like methyltransferase